MVLFSYNLGLKNGSQLAKMEEISSIKPEIKSEPKPEDTFETDYERRFRESWENIARFDGTDLGQREVK